MRARKRNAVRNITESSEDEEAPILCDSDIVPKMNKTTVLDV